MEARSEFVAILRDMRATLSRAFLRMTVEFVAFCFMITLPHQTQLVELS